MSHLIHVANVLILVSFCVKEILWLRVLSIVASVFFILYFINEELWAPIYWNVLFSVVNLYQLWRLILSRRPAQLNPLEQRLHQQVFPAMKDRDLQALVQLAQLASTSNDIRLVEEGEVTDALFLIENGVVEVRTRDSLVGTIGQNRFFGEMSFLSNTPSRVAIAASGGISYLTWSRESLQKHLQENPDTYAVMQKLLGDEMIRKYRTALDQAPA